MAVPGTRALHENWTGRVAEESLEWARQSRRMRAGDRQIQKRDPDDERRPEAHVWDELAEDRARTGQKKDPAKDDVADREPE